jgi:hypothetical protein
VAKEFYQDKNGVTANDNTNFGPYQMRVEGQTTPEPSSVVMLAAALLGGIVARGCVSRLRHAAA